jgi:hypothetical protein
MVIATKSSKRQPRKKKADKAQVTTFAFPAMAEEHLDIPTLETWLWDADCAIRFGRLRMEAIAGSGS